MANVPYAGSFIADEGARYTLDEARGAMRPWYKDHSPLQLEGAEAVPGLAAARKHNELHPNLWQKTNIGPSFASFGSERLMLLENDFGVKGKRFGGRRVLSQRHRGDSRPAFIEKSVTSTNTPSAFTITDPFAEWAAKTPPAATAETPPSEPPAAPEPRIEPAAEPTPPPPATPSEAQPDQVDTGVQPAAEVTREKEGGETKPASQVQADEVDAPVRPEDSEKAAEALAAAKEEAERQALQEAKNMETAKEGQKEKPEEPPSQAEASKTDVSRTGRRKAAMAGGKTLEKALAEKVEKMKLTEQETKDFVDTKGTYQMLPSLFTIYRELGSGIWESTLENMLRKHTLYSERFGFLCRGR